MFLELVREVAVQHPERARDALTGLSLYAAAKRPVPRPARPAVARIQGASLRDHGGKGPVVIFVPSLINPPHILDLDDEVSLTRTIAGQGYRSLLIDWGDAWDRSALSIAGHVEQLLLPLIDAIDEPVMLVGYCLGGTMAIAAANLRPVRGIATLAAPWHFSDYPDHGRESLRRLWDNARPSAEFFGALPMEVLQASFWSLDRERTVSKFAQLARLDPASAQFRRFVALEDWANDGDPLPLPSARELVEDFFSADAPGLGGWNVAGRAISAKPDCPALHFTAARDRITPAAAAPPGERLEQTAGHVGMVIGRSRAALHRALSDFLTSCR